ncbi:MAG: putative 2-aminoethylphosphonate ABC transporter ATP-binding protein [Comamonadaceae bacterium]|nr:MAG: putative 2-aminoethylphosphonate ABC transporter ATP-binding protein [Comamonadaceae bacterium]
MTASPTDAYVQLQGITKRFGKTEVLGNIDLSVAEGEFLCFLGPSGCGKSTLLRIVAGLEAQSAGRILKRGADVSRAAPAERDVGILFQSYALFPNLTVAKNVAYGLANRGMSAREIDGRVKALLDLVGLAGIEDRLPAQLSGGQQQRVALARALAPSPGLLLLDEPLSALDAKVRIHLRLQIRKLQKELRLTTIMVTHDQEEALTMADRIVVMNHGAIEQIGTPLEIYHQPATQFVADFVGKMNFLSALRGTGDQMMVGSVAFGMRPGTTLPREAGTLCFRPEEVSFLQGHDEAANSFAARVQTVEFLGSTWRALLGCPSLGAAPIMADFSSEDARRIGLKPEFELRVSVAPAHLHVFAAATPAAVR